MSFEETLCPLLCPFSPLLVPQLSSPNSPAYFTTLLENLASPVLLSELVAVAAPDPVLLSLRVDRLRRLENVFVGKVETRTLTEHLALDNVDAILTNRLGWTKGTEGWTFTSGTAATGAIDVEELIKITAVVENQPMRLPANKEPEESAQ